MNFKGSDHGHSKGRYYKSNVECYNHHKHCYNVNEFRTKDNDQSANSTQEVEDHGNHALLLVIVSLESSMYYISAVRGSFLLTWMNHFS